MPISVEIADMLCYIMLCYTESGFFYTNQWLGPHFLVDVQYPCEKYVVPGRILVYSLNYSIGVAF